MQKVRIGLIGCGNFSRVVHVPNLQNNPKYEVVAVVDLFEKNAQEAAEKVGAKYWTTDMDRVLADPEIDAVFITTRHDVHAELTIKAAKAGKHVLCEKPLGLNREECKAIAEAVKSSNVKYTVGYNRGIAPMITKTRELLKGDDHKKLVYHRMQARLPDDHWLLNREIGGGRFIGEGCHIFDLICEIIDKPPVMVYAAGGIFLNKEIVNVPDSGIITITFADGSVGTTLISNAGCAGMPKEVTEIYCNNKGIYVDDFTKMDYYGFEGHAKTSLQFDGGDKGHVLLLNQFADSILYGTEVPVGLNKAARAAVISYMANESIEKGVPVAIKESDYTF
jgi:predicted dehydrogenase